MLNIFLLNQLILTSQGYNGQFVIHVVISIPIFPDYDTIYSPLLHSLSKR